MAEHEVAGLGRGERGGDGFVLAHFPDHDDIGVLAEDMDEGAVEGVGVGQDFLLDDDGAFVPVHVFDGVLDGDDLAPALAVDQVDHVVERGGFAGAGGPGDQDQAVGSRASSSILAGSPSSSRLGMRSPQNRMLSSGWPSRR